MKNKPFLAKAIAKSLPKIRASTQAQIDKAIAAATGGTPPKKPHVRHEQPFHIAVVQNLDVILPRDFIYWHTPNGETGRGKAKGGILKALGVMAGVHDILILGPDGRLHGLELKWGDNDLSDAQKEFGAALVGRGCTWACCWTIEEVYAFIERLCASYGLSPRGRLS